MQWGIAYYKRPAGSIPAVGFLDSCPVTGRQHYRLFCRLENGTSEELKALGFDRPQIVVINGMVKRNASLFTAGDYKKQVLDLGNEYMSRTPRPVAR